MPFTDTTLQQAKPTILRNPSAKARWSLFGVGLGALAGLIVFVYWWAHSIVGPHHDQFDLQIYFRTVRFWLAGNNIYDYAQPDPVNGSLGFTYPPLAAVLMAPMGALSWPVVKAVTVIAILSATAACVWLCLRERVRLAPRWMVLAVGATTAGMFLLDPIRQNLSFGQINMFLGVLVFVDLLVLQPRGSRWAGVGIGLAMAIKITPGLFLIYFLLGRQWRPAITALISAAVATAAAAVVAPTATWTFYTSLLWDSDRVGHIGGAANQSIEGLLARVGTIDHPDKAAWLILVVLVFAVGMFRVRRALSAGDRLTAITLTGLTGVLISPVSWPHHLVWLIPAVIILVSATVRVVAELRERIPAVGWVAALRPLVMPVLLLGTGVLVLGFDTRITFGLPDVQYDNISLIGRLGASALMFWVLLALLTLPITPQDEALARTEQRAIAEPAAA